MILRHDAELVAMSSRWNRMLERLGSGGRRWCTRRLVWGLLQLVALFDLRYPRPLVYIQCYTSCSTRMIYRSYLAPPPYRDDLRNLCLAFCSSFITAASSS